MSGGLASKSGYQTHENTQRREQAFAKGKESYEKLFEAARSAGVKGVRTGMRRATIEQKMRASGVRAASEAVDKMALDQAIADSNGFIEIKDNSLSRAGVFPYSGRKLPGAPDPERACLVYRPADELASPETVESFKLHRRRLKPSRFAFVALEIEKVEAQRAKERMLVGKKPAPVLIVAQGSFGEASEKAAIALEQTILVLLTPSA